MSSDLFTETQKNILTSIDATDSSVESLTPLAFLRIPDLGYSFLLVNLDPKTQVGYALCDFDTDIIVQKININYLKDLALKNSSTLTSDQNYEAKYPLKVYKDVAIYFGTMLPYSENPKAEPLFLKFSAYNCEK
jgi:hypothetical protein